jgi:glycosyltransferase involved in cell wall biosynthesis
MPVKVLHVTFDMTIGGTQQVIRQLVEYMDDSEVQSEIACIDGKLGELGEMLQGKGVSIHTLKRQPGFDISLIIMLFQLIKTNQYDIIHCHQYTPFVYGLIASILTSAKVIFTEHGRFYPDFGTRKRRLMNPIFGMLTTKITAISQATRQALVKFEGFNPDKIEVIYNGIVDKSGIEVDEVALKAQFNIPQSAFIFGTISRLQPIKNQPLMIKAFKLINDQNKETHLLIVGDGKIRSGLEKLVQELELGSYVTFTGFQENPYQFHRIIDVFLLSSFSEGASMTLIECMSFSKPCVVTDVGGNPELVSQRVNGLVVKSGSVDDLVKACELFLNHPSECRLMGKSAKIEFESRFTASRMINEYQKLYSQ